VVEVPLPTLAASELPVAHATPPASGHASADRLSKHHGAVAESGPNGFLTLTTYPWTRVSEGGKVLGNTPLYKVPLSPGEHTLTLENPDKGIKQTTGVTIKSGEVTAKQLGFE
jgi:serine/threonine-protein kinase